MYGYANTFGDVVSDVMYDGWPTLAQEMHIRLSYTVMQYFCISYVVMSRMHQKEYEFQNSWWMMLCELYRMRRICPLLNSLRLRQNGRHFADDVFKCNFFNENVWIYD